MFIRDRATITLQNYFRMCDKLAGMTGTAQAEAADLHQIYKLGVVQVPTNRPMVRRDNSDLVYRTEKAKFDAVVEDIVEKYEVGQPVLVGTTSVEKSEYLSQPVSYTHLDVYKRQGPDRRQEAARVRLVVRPRHRRKGQHLRVAALRHDAGEVRQRVRAQQDHAVGEHGYAVRERYVERGGPLGGRR